MCPNRKMYVIHADPLGAEGIQRDNIVELLKKSLKIIRLCVGTLYKMEGKFYKLAALLRE